MKALPLLALLALPLAALSQTAPGVGIGIAVPNASAVLDLTSTNQGILVPRLTQAQRQGIANPAIGLLVFQRDGAQPGFWYYAASGGWVFFNPSADNLGNHTASQNLNLQGNALVGTGASIGSTVGVGVRADGGLNLGQNTAGNNVFLGYQAGQATVPDVNNNRGVKNHFSGYQSGKANTTGSYNQFSGYQSGYRNTTGQSNQFDGLGSGSNNSSGSNNLFVGFFSGLANLTGSRNLAVGYHSGYLNTAGSMNLFVGYESGFSNAKDGNQFIGYQSGYSNTTGLFNQFSGYQSGYNSIGYRNQFDGYLSGYNTTTGSSNLFVGLSSGYHNTTGNNNTALGYAAGPTTGNLTNATAIGYNAFVSQSNSLVLGGTGPDAVQVGIGTTAPDVPLDVQGLGDATAGSFAFYALAGNGQPRTGGADGGYLNNVSIRASGRVVALEFNATSDARLKTVLGRSDNAADLALLRQLRITDYQLRDRAQFGERRFKKVIAQEVEQVFPQAVSCQKGFLPDIYAVPTATQFQGDSLLVLALPASLPEAAHAGQRLRLVGPAGEVLARVARPAAAGTRTLVVRGVPATTSQLFVFGLEHADVRAVDYEALAMLNVSATQELARRLAALEAANATLRQQAATTAGFEQRLRALEAAGAQAAGR